VILPGPENAHLESMMKTFLGLISAAFVLQAVPAFAATDSLGKPIFEYTFYKQAAGRSTLISCNYAETKARAWMEEFGAKDLDIACTGGIQPLPQLITPIPLSLRIAYSPSVIPTRTRQQALVIDSGAYPNESSCDFDSSLLQALLGEFKGVVAVKQALASCERTPARYHYELTLTKAD
jgi:hypothetical protein